MNKLSSLFKCAQNLGQSYSALLNYAVKRSISSTLSYQLSKNSLDSATNSVTKQIFSSKSRLFSSSQICFKKTSKDHKDKSTDIDETNKEDDEERDERDSEIDEDDDNNDVLKSIDTTGFQPGYKIIVKHIQSARLDTVLAAGLNISRNKVDDSFYSSKLRLNGEKVVKKSIQIKEMDELDMIGDMNDKAKKRNLKRVVLYKILDEKSKKSNKSKVVLVVWKTGLFEEDAYKHDRFK